MDGQPLPQTDMIRAACRSTIQLMDDLDRLRPQIEEAMDMGLRTHSFDDICQMVLGQEMTLHLFEDSFFLTCVQPFPQARHYHVFIAGGNMETLIAAVPSLIEDARATQCQRITVNGRPGWARVLKRVGAKQTYAMMALEVE